VLNLIKDEAVSQIAASEEEIRNSSSSDSTSLKKASIAAIEM